MTESKSIIDLKPLPQDDPTQRRPDITLAKEKLNWDPQIKLDQGLVKTIEYFKNII
jgi:UDP-glucuronate decarboxylase